MIENPDDMIVPTVENIESIRAAMLRIADQLCEAYADDENFQRIAKELREMKR